MGAYLHIALRICQRIIDVGVLLDGGHLAAGKSFRSRN